MEMQADSTHVMDKISRTIFERSIDLLVFASQGKDIFDNDTNKISLEKLKDFENVLREYERYSKSYSSISIYDLDGIKISDTRGLGVGIDNDSQEMFFQKGLVKNYFDKYPVFSNEVKREVIHFSSPIKNSEGELIGVLVARMPTTRLYDIIDTSNEHKEGFESHLLTDKGAMIFSTSNTQKFDLQLFELLNDKKIIITDTEQLSEIFVMVSDDGYLYEETTGWNLVTQVPTTLAYDSLFELERNTFLVIIAILIISTVFVKFITNSFSKPIFKIAEISQNIANGSTTQKFPIIHTNNEINMLSKSLQKMYQYEEDLRSKLQSNYDKLKKATKTKDEFMSMLSHEMKTPLVPILGHSEMLLTPDLIGTLNDDQLSAVKNIEKNGKHLQKMILELLDLQKTGLNQIKLISNEIDVNGLLEEIQSEFTSKAKEKNGSIEIDSQNTFTISGDRNRLKQILSNLILNAIDFLPKKEGKIKIGAVNENNNVTFHVFDNGCGIPTEDLLKIFVRFYQVDTGPSRAHEGSGLGLSVCKELVEHMGGQIWAQSQEGEGSKFYFTITTKLQV